MRKFSIALLAVVALSFAHSAQAAITLVATKNAVQTDADLDVWTVFATGTAGEVINSFAGLNIASGVHNVQPPFGQAATTINQWASDGSNGASLAAWKAFDTYFLFNPATDAAFAVGSFAETNDGTDPAGLALTNAGQNATEGLGSFRHVLNTDQVTIIPGLASANVAFLQVAQPVGTTTLLNAVIFDNQGNRADFTAFPIGIPEPATLAMAGMSLLGLAFRRRNG